MTSNVQIVMRHGVMYGNVICLLVKHAEPSKAITFIPLTLSAA